MPNTNQPDTPRPTVQTPKTPEKQKQENGFQPNPEHCKKNKLFQNYDSPPDGNTDNNVV